MSGAEKIAISAAIGGTAEALGGGKFANGAVTGAYVMMFNHMAEQIQYKRKRNVPSKEWLENKANEAIKAEKAKIDDWIKGGGSVTNVDLNYEDYSNSNGAFNMYNEPVTTEITLTIGGKR